MNTTVSLRGDADIVMSRFGLPQRLILAAGAFAVATAEFLMMGTLPDVARGLDASVSAAGQLVGAFALGIAIGGPLLAGMTARADRRRVLAGAMLGFLLANLLLALSSSYPLALALRFIGGALGGLFYGVAFASVARMAEPGREAGAIATVLGGVTLATVFGTPLGAWAGQLWGWRLPYAVIAVGALGIAGLVIRQLPSIAGEATLRRGWRGAVDGIGRMLGVFTARPLAVMLLAIAVVNTGWFTVYTYIAPYWSETGGVAAASVPVALLAYGVFSAVGGAWGGRLANGGARRPLLFSIGAHGLLLAALPLASGDAGATLLLSMAWALSAWIFVSAAQARVVELAGERRDLASSVAVSAFNVGNAAGAAIGGSVLGVVGIGGLPWVAAGMTALGLFLAWRARPVS